MVGCFDTGNGLGGEDSFDLEFVLGEEDVLGRVDLEEDNTGSYVVEVLVNDDCCTGG